MVFPRIQIEKNRRLNTQALAAVVVATLGIAGSRAEAAPAAGTDEPRALVDKAEWLLQRGQVEAAQELVTRAAAGRPDFEPYALARAKAYLTEQNPFWALKVLGEFIAQHPPACAARAFAARVHIQEANLDQAEQILDAPECERADESRLRILLLRTELAELRGEREKALRLVTSAQMTNHRYVEDDLRLARLDSLYVAHREPTLAFRLELGAGWASRGIGTLPLDLATPTVHSGSPFVGMDLSARLVPLTFATWRPVAEVELHLAQYLDTPAKAYSSRQPLVRWGLEFGRRDRKLLMAYAADWVNLDGGSQYPYDGFAYSEGQRGELHLTIDGSFHAYGSLGYRRFWQSDRSRLETNQGLSRSLRLSDTLNLTLGREFRAYLGNHSAYTQVGATLYAGLDVTMPKGLLLQETVALGRDVFPRSEGYFAADVHETRRDTLVRVSVGLTTPEWLGLRFGFTYGYANRDSNIAAYDYADHRGVISVAWQSDSERLRVDRIPKSGRVPLPYPDDETKVTAKSNAEVIEVIRQDERQRDHTSCMK
jgi:hypothetical protein